jgi:hypothetical protein
MSVDVSYQSMIVDSIQSYIDFVSKGVGGGEFFETGRVNFGGG